jgi:hypothetical protein
MSRREVKTAVRIPTSLGIALNEYRPEKNVASVLAGAIAEGAVVIELVEDLVTLLRATDDASAADGEARRRRHVRQTVRGVGPVCVRHGTRIAVICVKPFGFSRARVGKPVLESVRRLARTWPD